MIVTSNRATLYFRTTALIFLLLGLVFGFMGSIQYLFPSWLKDDFSFARTRPLHVSFVISWIFTGASAGIYYYLPKITGIPLYSTKLAILHWVLMVFSMIAITVSYLLGIFGGREYLEFPPWISIIIFTYWSVFMFNYFMSLRKTVDKVPVYVWMWSTGLIFFFLTFLEAHLWLFSFFRNNIVRDTTVQWKAMGSMVGSWNMLLYGTAFYLMEKISGNTQIARSKQTFFFYFLGLTNLMFNWGHHTYIVPASAWIKDTAYFVSMTELLILGHILRQWKRSLSQAKKNFHRLPYRFLVAADVWIFINLCLAIAMSIPSINLYTHGTLVTVAHAMGATIGINTMILLASFTFMAEEKAGYQVGPSGKWINFGFWISNFSLLLFWISLLASGTMQAMMKENIPHILLMEKLLPFFRFFTGSGLILLVGIFLIVFPLVKQQLSFIKINK